MAQEASRFVVGIDLGTTNSAVGYIDTAEARWQVHTLAIPQVVAPGEVEIVSAEDDVIADGDALELELAILCSVFA